MTYRHKEITDDLDALLAALPEGLAEDLRAVADSTDLLEVVLDLGRTPEARFLDKEIMLSEREITRDDLERVEARIGDFGDDNRAGIERTLHRISAIRNRKGRVVGLTCRVGRAVYGTIDIIQDIIASGQSVLLLGRPGVGKTTMLREVARVLSETKRVVIVDTSNEIGGDGDIPHPSIGRARRMQVATPTMQHGVMIEAVENHMPEVIVIDEIGTELEAAAARTIAERGVQLIGTAHGNTLDNLMMNPTLCDLVGGIQSVTLGDEEARRRGTQKSVLERKAPPTFEVMVEIQDWDRIAVRPKVADAVDAILRGRGIPPEIRQRDAAGEVHVEVAALPAESTKEKAISARDLARYATRDSSQPLKIYPYGINKNRLRQASRELSVPVQIIGELTKSDAVFTLRSHYRKRPAALSAAENQGIPIYVLRSNTVIQMERYLAEIFGLRAEVDPQMLAMQETERAIAEVLSGVSKVDLMPQNAYIRRKQHEMARRSNVLSLSAGKDPGRYVRIYQDPRLGS
jgi:stage III sporulation protein SpoIIIAA